jgi:drug/metabolite transporter (DMT)-like permease
MSNLQSIFAIISAMIAGIIVGVAVVLTRYAQQEATPETLALLRYGIGVLCMIPIVIFAAKTRFRRADILPIAILGIFQFAILILLLNHSLNYISSARATLVFSTLPLQTMIIAALMGKERLIFQKTFGILITLAGLTIAEWPNLVSATAASDDNWIGISLAATSALCGALCSIFYKPYLSRYPTTMISSFAMFASVLFLFAYNLPTDAFRQIPTYSSNIWIAIIAVGACSALGYFTWLWGLKHLTATTVTMFLCLGPVTATLLGAVFLNEAVTLPFAVGLCVVIIGIITALSAKGKKAHAIDAPLN